MLMHGFFACVVLCAYFTRKKRRFLWLSAAALFVFAALRYQFGNDYSNYYRCFLEITCMGENPFTGEPLYTLLNLLMPHFFWLIAVSSLLFVTGIHRLIRQNVPPDWLWASYALLLINPYLFLMHLSAIRQSLALVCFICAIPFAYRHRPLPYCALILAACFFHNSAFVLFPVYFIANVRNVSRRETILIATATAVLLILGHLLYRFLYSSLALMQLTRYQYVLSDGLHNSLRATLLSSITFFYLLWNMPRLRGKTLLYAKLWLVGSTLSVLAFRMSMLTRVEMYFDLFSIVALPRMLLRPRKDSALPGLINNWLFPSAIVLILVLRYYSFFHNAMWADFAVYHSILELLKTV